MDAKKVWENRFDVRILDHVVRLRVGIFYLYL